MVEFWGIPRLICVVFRVIPVCIQFHVILRFSHQELPSHISSLMEGPWLGWSSCFLPKCVHFFSLSLRWGMLFVRLALYFQFVCRIAACFSLMILFPCVICRVFFLPTKVCSLALCLTFGVLYRSPWPEPWFYHSCPGPATWGRFWLRVSGAV